jgi:hypothetical protein
MKLALKILKLLVMLVFTVSVLLFAASTILQERVAGIILTSINRNVSTKVEVGSFKLSFLRKFPRSSLELRDVLVHSSSNFSSDEFTGINTDTLLSARNVSVEFRITDIIKGNYNIESITAKTGRMNFFSDRSGFVNYDIAVKGKTSGNEVFSMNFEKVMLKDIKAYYDNRAVKLIIAGIVKNGKLKTRISGENIEFMARSDVEITHFQLYNTIIDKTITAGLDIALISSKTGIRFKKSSLAIENYDFDMDGFLSSEQMLDLNISGNNIDLSGIRKYLPEKYLSLTSDYNPAGILKVICKVRGPLTKTKNPHVEINYILKNGSISYGKSHLNIKNLSFTGNLSNGSKNNFETSVLSLDDIKVILGSAEYNGSFKISDFNHPKSELFIKGRVLPNELAGFFDLKNISTAEGFVDVDLKVITDFWPKGTDTQNKFTDLKPEGNLIFNSFSLGFQNNKLLVSNINGNVTFSNFIIARNLSFTYKGQEIKVDGQVKNLPDWFAGRPVKLIASADVSFNRLIPETFVKESPSSEKTVINMPGDLILDLHFKIDSLTYKTFSSSKITGTLNYKPRLLTIKTFNMNSLGGIVSGNGFIVQNRSKAIIARSNLNVKDIDVNTAFNTFHNFGQDFIRAENLAGNLSGSLSLLLPMDLTLNPDIKSLTAEGNFLLVNGALINFEPVKELSSFIELSELENIHFEKLENDFFIRNNFLYLPQMNVRSSAADLSVNGKHSFDNDYEYHVKMLLSEILSKKRNKNKRNVTEFGTVQDDGLGRTSLLLKITGKGEVVKVGYDVKAAGSELKNNIKAERQTLKSILNQEYGWYKSDTTLKQKQAEGKKTRFRITWDDNHKK